MQNPVIDKFGTKQWCLNGKYHRIDGPAVEYTDGSKFWLLNGDLHREDGPAIEYSNGNKFWYYHGEQLNCYSNEKFFKLLKLKVFW